MLDQPPPCEGILKPVKPQVSNSLKAQANLQEPVAQPERAAWHHGVARPTFVQIRKSAAVGQIRRKIGVGLGGLAVAAALGWAVARLPVERIAATEIEAPPRQADAWEVYPESGTPMPEAAALPPVEDVQSASREEPPPPEQVPSAAAPADAEPVATSFFEASVRLEKGDTLGSALRELGFAAQDVADAVAALTSHVSMKRLPVGQAVTVKMRPPDDEAHASPILLALTIRPEPRREITLERDDEGDYSVEVEIYDVVSKLQRASGTVEGSVINSAEAAGVPRPALVEMLRAFSWDVNFQHDIKVGDRFDVLIEQAWTSDGWPVDAGRVLWAELTTGGGEQSFSIYRFKPHDGEEFFYNSEGESVVKALLRTPLNMSRISSRFGMRHHPVLRFTRLHAGIDFAAPPGTPILAAGAGRVVEAGPNGGYGRWVKISHANGLATGYAHLSRIAPGVRRSARVRQGQVIGFVGSSGLSTGPHLHFELHRNGRPVNPLSVAQTAMRTRLGGEDLARFKAHVVEIDRARETAANGKYQ